MGLWVIGFVLIVYIHLFVHFVGADLLPTYLIVSDRRSIHGVHLEHQSSVTFTTAGLSKSVGLDFFYNESQIYWGDLDSGKIYRGKLVSNSIIEIEAVIMGGLASLEGIAVDWIAGNLYWVDGYLGHIEVAKLDGSYRTVLLENVGKPRGLAVDPRGGLIFWSNWEHDAPSINRCSMSGDASTKTVVYQYDEDQVAWPNGLTLDYQLRRVYWVNARSKSIHTVKYDGSDHQEILKSEKYLSHPYGITLFGDRLYWTDWREYSVFTTSKFNVSDVKTVFRNVGQLYDLKIYHPMGQPSRSVPNPCEVNNGGCDQLCLIHLQNEHRCACQYGYILNPNEKTCTPIESFLLYAIVPSIGIGEIHGLSVDLKTLRVSPAVFSEFKQTILDYDPQDDTLYWSDTHLRVINKAPLNGTQPKTAIMIETELPDPPSLCFAIDWVSRNLYFSTFQKSSENKTKGQIWVSSLEGRYRTELVATGIVKSLAVHPMKGKMFWIDITDDNQSVMSANMDGTDVTQLFPRNGSDTWVVDPKRLVIDYVNQKLYWLNGGKKPNGIEIICSTLDGTEYNVVKRFAPGVSITALALFENAAESTILVADNKGIMMRNGRTGEMKYVWKFDDHQNRYPRFPKTYRSRYMYGRVDSNPPHITSMAVYDMRKKQGKNACTKNNHGGCSQLCLPVKNRAVCTEEDEQKLSSPEKRFTGKIQHQVEFPDSCPPSFIKFRSSCYHFADNASRSLSWQTANERCKEKSAHLVTIESRDVHDFVKSKINKVPDTKAWWIGLNDLQHINKWVWSGTGKVVKYNGWYPGEPNASYQHCVGLWGGVFGFSFIDADCNGYSYFTTSYICERLAQ